MVEMVDAEVGRVYDALRGSRHAENTLFVSQRVRRPHRPASQTQIVRESLNKQDQPVGPR
jgi:hypothetical protein